MNASAVAHRSAAPAAHEFEPFIWKGRPMSEAPRDGTWILVRISICDEYDVQHDLIVAAQYLEVHGGFRGLPMGASFGQVQAPLWPFSWMPQPAFR